MEEHILPTPSGRFHRLKAYLRDPHISFAGFLVLALALAAMLFVVGFLLYVNSNEYKLDITRPGFRGIDTNQLVQVNSDQTYDSSSPIDQKALQDEQRSANSRLQDFSHYGDFNDSALSNIQNNLFNEPANPSQ
jgi:hypothetical protein